MVRAMGFTVQLRTLGKATSFPGSLILPPPGGDPGAKVVGKGESRLPCDKSGTPVISLRGVNHGFQSYFMGCSG